MSRTIQEVFESHREAIEKGDIEQLAGDYAEDAVMITLDGAFQDREMIMNGFFKTIFDQFPDTKITFEKVVYEGDMCLLEWSATASTGDVPHGVGAFLIRDGFIQRQWEWFHMNLKE
jgi:ketosteroid isomerase-like protein